MYALYVWRSSCRNGGSAVRTQDIEKGDSSP
ncbi:rCG30174 [Rattus norvegicus]|uniref:RCG30174 n=1 Tax=Rattus norvegicus TaxID=10116 RepID=A6IMH2_RAT|nr:rCG30174 [Rattus norvegicus]